MHHLSLPLLLQVTPNFHVRLKEETAKAQTWEMTGNDPQFLLAGIRTKLPRGMYWLSVELGSPAQLFDPKLYIDTGHGHNEDEVVRMVVSDDHMRISARFELAVPAVGLRFDPSQKRGEICIARVQLRRISTTGWRLWRVLRVLARRLRSPEKLNDVARRGLALYRKGGFVSWRQALAQEVERLDPSPVSSGSYEQWIKFYDTLTSERLTSMHADVEALAFKPLISVLMPVYNTPERLLCEAIESVKAQAYPHWELCIADDASTAPHVHRILRRYAKNDTRIKVAFREINGHICHASNSALDLVTGEWIALLDHDDVLRPHALYEVARTINLHPDTELIYSDEDKIDESGRRYDAFFKPDFSIEMFRSQNYFNHLTVHRAANVRAVGGWRAGFEGSQDYDLNLRIIETTTADRIRHIPKILYHWRAVSGSTAVSASEKGYAWEAGRRALETHLTRVGLDGVVKEIPSVPFYRLCPSIPEPQPLVSLIVPTRDGLTLLRNCIESIRAKTVYDNYEIIVVDNGSRDP
ncbi:MAG: glycosyltransferase, partial [Variibacter sp.]